MASYNKLTAKFKTIVNFLFKSNGFQCRKLFYGNEVFYCCRDILMCSNYSEYMGIITEILLLINKDDKFTIKELEEKYSWSTSKTDNNNISNQNKELISSQEQYELEYIYINKTVLYKLISYFKKPKAKAFKDFIYRILPILDDIYKELILEEQEKLMNCKKKFKNTRMVKMF